MSLESSMKTLLGPVVAGRVYPDVTPDNPTFPLIVYQQVGGTAYEYTDSTLPNHDHARMQVYVWSRSRLEATALARQARAAIIGSTLVAQTYGAAVSTFDDTLKLYGSRTDYGIWYLP
jgi:hypothetical protein